MELELQKFSVNDNFYMINEEKNQHDVSFYSLFIGIEEYFKTYSRVCMSLNRYKRNRREYIDFSAKENDRYIKSYLNIAIHTQHFFELEIKKILEKEHILFAIDDKDDVVIMNKLIKGIKLTSEDTNKYKSVEFSVALERLKDLVNKGIIADEIGDIMVKNYKLLKVLNYLRNTTIHKGRRILKYCQLDDLFSQEVFPLLIDLFEKDEYKKYKRMCEESGIYYYIKAIADEGKKSDIDYAEIAFNKEMARCKYYLSSKVVPYEDESGVIEALIQKRFNPNEEEYLENKRCPCCKQKTLFYGQEFVGYDVDELGDEMSTVGRVQIVYIPEYEEYYECVWCSFRFTDFLKIDINELESDK